MTMSFSAADQKKIDIMGCCFRKPVDCPKVRDGTNRCTVASNLFSSRRAASVVSSFAKAARGPDEMEPGVIEKLIASRATNKKCTRWKSGWCHQAESHGPFPHAARRRNPSRSSADRRVSLDGYAFSERHAYTGTTSSALPLRGHTSVSYRKIWNK